MSRPLNGIKVLEMDCFVASPCVCRLLADLGAEVIKIEKPTGDSWRDGSIAYNRNVFNNDANPIYDIYNAGKKHIVLDLKNPEGKKVFFKLLGECDVFVTNTRLAAMKRLGLSYDDLKEDYPHIVYAMVEGFGEKGEDANTAAYDNTAYWARCGMLRDLAMIDKDGSYNPIYSPSSVGDTTTAYLLLAEITTALLQRHTTGKGQLVKAGLFHTGIFTFGSMQICSQRPFGRKYPKKVYEHGHYTGSFRCKDGEYIYIATGVWERTYDAIVKVIGKPELYEEERFSTPAKTFQNAAEFREILEEAFLTKTREEWIPICKEYDLAVSRLNGFADISEDPQAIANGFIEDVKMRDGKVIKMPSCPLDMESLQGEDMSTHPATVLGHDTDEVLREFGYSDAEIKALYDADVITPKA